MLVSALAATLVGFGLLVVALVTGTLWLAVACIVVCVAGAFLLLADVLGLDEPITRRLAARRRTRRDDVPVDPDGSAGVEGHGPASHGLAPDEPSAAEVTTEFARVDPETGTDPTVPAPASPVSDTDPGPLPSHHARHGEPEEPADDHAHVRRDDSGRPAEVFRLSHTPHHSRHSVTADTVASGDTDVVAPTSAESTDEVPHSRHRSHD